MSEIPSSDDVVRPVKLRPGNTPLSHLNFD